MTDPQQFYVAGYVLTVSITTPKGLSQGLLPPTIVSGGGCIVPRPGIVEWAGGELEKLGVPPEKLPAVEAWAATAFETEFGYPDMFYTLAAARDYVKRFIPNPPESLALLGLALDADLAETFRQKERTEAVGTRGLYDKLRKREAPAPGGTALGYEPLCADGFDFAHTWLCNLLHVSLAVELGFKPNAHGFIAHYADAKWLADVAVPHGAEPGLWLPWKIVRYAHLSEQD